MDGQLEHVLQDDYLGDLTGLDLDDLRARRAECQAIETQLSYLRRLVQGHHDIATAELQRRREGGDPSDLSALVAQLPAILSDRIHAPGNGHLPQQMEPGELSGELPARLDALLAGTDLDHLDSLTDEQLDRVGVQLAELEQDVSGYRRQLFERIDAVQDELARRYRTGEATLDVPT
jgi:hypothetical protein